MQWIEEEACPACGCKEMTFHGYGYIPGIRIPDILAGCPLSVTTGHMKCDQCGLIFQNPHMDNDGIDEYYRTGVYRQLLGKDGLEGRENSEARGQMAWADMVGPGKHLDIGCSHGLMLELTSVKGCEVMGVEPNREYVSPSVPSVASIYEVQGEWDTITCKHTLEHVPDLQKFVAKVIELLKPGGRLILEVPAEGTPGATLRLAHLYQFNEQNLRDLFKGLTVEKYEANPHHFFILRKAANEKETGDSRLRHKHKG